MGRRTRTQPTSNKGSNPVGPGFQSIQRKMDVTQLSED